MNNPYRFAEFLAVLLLVVAVTGCSRQQTSTERTSPDPVKDVDRQPRIVLPDVDATDIDGEISEMESLSLVQLLGDSDYQRRLDAADELVSRGGDSIELVEAGLDSENYHVRAGCAFALGMFEEQAASSVVKLKKLATDDPRDAVRAAAAFAVDRIEAE